MCRRVTCPSCNKPTYAGCGAHIEQVLGDVAPAQRCQCRERADHAATGESSAGLAGFVRKLLGG
jgi:hypothetical protein